MKIRNRNYSVPFACPVVGSSCFATFSFKLASVDIVQALRLQFHGDVLNDSFNEGLVSAHLGLLHHLHLVPDPRAEHKLRPLGQLVAGLQIEMMVMVVMITMILMYPKPRVSGVRFFLKSANSFPVHFTPIFVSVYVKKAQLMSAFWSLMTSL